jgi:Esterase-like activity of phytase
MLQNVYQLSEWISDIESAHSPRLTFRALADPAPAEVRILPKTLVLDLSSIKGMPEKIEGIALLDQNTLAVANDNDFDSEENKYDADGNNIGKGKISQILIISLAKPLPLEQATVATSFF